jgi:hypothetical protein
MSEWAIDMSEWAIKSTSFKLVLLPKLKINHLMGENLFQKHFE